MKKIFLSLLFVAFSVSVNAQNPVDRQTIKNNPNNLNEYVLEDITILSNNFDAVTEDHEQALSELCYYKYKMLTSDITGEELVDLTNSLKERIRVVLGDELYLEVSQNQPIFYRITGTTYLAQ